jgi:hypothetical protein
MSKRILGRLARSMKGMKGYIDIGFLRWKIYAII